MINRVKVPFKPHKYQQEIIDSLKRFSVLVCHRRFGKSTLMINLLLRWALQNKRRDWRGAYIAPFRNQAKAIAWDYLQHYADPIPGTKVNQSELKIDFQNGSRICLLGADYPDSLRGPYWDAVIFDEYAQIAPNCFSEIIRPSLVDRKGWALFIGTPKGHNHFHKLWTEDSTKDPDGWLRLMFRASETDILDKEELENTRQIQSPEEYEQEFECSFEAALIGAYYGPLMQDALTEGRITDVPYDPALLVDTAWDIGVDDATSIWFFQVTPGGAIKFIDYAEASNFGLDHWVSVIKGKKYVYGTHLMPHDIKAREPTTARSRLEFLQGLGLQASVVRLSQVADGIQAARQIIPKAWFNVVKCDRGIQALKAYRKEYSQKLSTFKDCPLHDWSSHGADAFRTAAMGMEMILSSGPILKIKMPSMVQYGKDGWML